MLIDEINNLLSSELELLKELRSYEAGYLHKLKKLESTKHRLLANNRDNAKKLIETLRHSEMKSAQERADKFRRDFERKSSKLRSIYQKKKKGMLDQIYKEIKDVHAKETV